MSIVTDTSRAEADRAAATERGWRGRALPFVLLVSGLAISAALLATKPTSTPNPVTERVRRVQMAEVAMRSFPLDVTAHGAVMPQREIQLVSEVEGRVAGLSDAYTAGGAFEADAVLLRLEDTDYVDRLREAEAAVTLAEAEAREAHADLGREERLASSDIASASRLGDAETRRDVSRARLERARAQHARAERDLARTQIVAPWAGRVREKYVDVGQFVRRGTELGRVFASDFAEVRLPVATRVLGDLDIRTTALAGGVLEAGPDVALTARIGQHVHTWKAGIARVEAALDPRNRSVTLVARVADPYGAGVSDAGLPLPVGLFVEARIAGRTLEDAVALPRSAFDGTRVGVIDDGRLAFREVEIATWSGDEALVVAGLSPGEVVCLDLPAGAVEGMRVESLAAADEDPAT